MEGEALGGDGGSGDLEESAPSIEKKDFRKGKRKRFHQALLNLYLPPSPPRSPPPRLPQIPVEELVPLVCGDLDSNFDQDVDNNGSESSQALADDLVPKKLTRAQRKRLRKRKLKETASIGRKIIGPLLPSNVQYVNELE
ncbi:uncharacterized protein LOC122036539 [Zingiber officinale]|uniref:uncharacterized protein LOC122036539 n=1 Tax=Zingiber officinale TaxID=94328 RepID=UPI001C4BA37F|nr:uncharacterized protein LOC122036539 [Zingiber officinale]